MGSTTFTANRGFRGGAIYNSAGDEETGTPAAITTFPADTVFVDNTADVRMTAAPLVVVRVYECQVHQMQLLCCTQCRTPT